MVTMDPFAALIFDMDGVIIDSEPRHERAFLDVFQELGYAETHGMDFPSYYGRSDRALWLDFIDKHRPSWSLEELTDWKQRRFLELIRHEEPIFAELPELLGKLAPVYRLGVASGSFHPVIDQVLAMKNLRRFFPVVVSVEDVSRGKPAPDVFLRAAELLNVNPHRCCVIEDASAGVDAALTAGMAVIAITNSLSADKLAHATWVVKSYKEIEEILLGKPNAAGRSGAAEQSAAG
jgi:beta-phosphoglucomutase-like phosphatase (HAD superfamily)